MRACSLSHRATVRMNARNRSTCNDGEAWRLLNDKPQASDFRCRPGNHREPIHTHVDREPRHFASRLCVNRCRPPVLRDSIPTPFRPRLRRLATTPSCTSMRRR